MKYLQIHMDSKQHGSFDSVWWRFSFALLRWRPTALIFLLLLLCGAKRGLESNFLALPKLDSSSSFLRNNPYGIFFPFAAKPTKHALHKEKCIGIITDRHTYMHSTAASWKKEKKMRRPIVTYTCVGGKTLKMQGIMAWKFQLFKTQGLLQPILV